MDVNLDMAWQRLFAMARSAVALLPNVVIAVIVFVILWLVAKILGVIVNRVARRAGQDAQVAMVLQRLASWFVTALGVMVAVTIVAPSLDTASLLSALGFGGVAIGFAFKDIFQNLLAGLLILITKPFTIGDQIVSGAHEGTVEDIEVRATMLRTYDNRRVVIPNSELYTNRVVVNTGYPARRVELEVGVGSAGDVPKAEATIRAELDKLDRVLREPAPAVLVRELGPYSVNLAIRYWINPTVRREVVESADEVLRAIAPALARAGVEMPYPTQTLRLEQAAPRDAAHASQAGAVHG